MLFIILLLAGAVFAAFLFDMFKKPERSVYFYLLVRFAFPKHLEMDLGGETVFMWRAAETVAFLIVMTVVMVHRKELASRLANLPPLRRFVLALAVTLAVSTFVPLLLALVGLRPRPVEVSVLRQGFLATHYLFALGVFLAAILFLNSVDKVQSVLKWVLVCGVAALGDLIWLYGLDLAPSVREATTGTSGGFGGMAFGGPDALGRGAIFAVFAALALHKIRNSRWYLGLALCLPVLIVVAASRPVAISLIAALLFYKIIDRRRPALSGAPFKPAVAVATCLLVPLGIAAFEGNVLGWVQSATGRSDFFQPELGVLTRLTIWVRAADVFLDTFPFGSGGGLLPFYMAGFKGSSVTSHFGLSGQMQEFYQQLIDWRLSSVHNLYLEFIAENGLGGLILVVWFGLLVFQAFRRFLALRASMEPRLLALQVSLFSILFAAALNVHTDATFKIYWFYLILLYAVQFLTSRPSSHVAA